jgi:hypothetical protein
MADLLERASNWLEEQRRRHASRVVTYVRGGRTLDVLATIGKTLFEVDDGYGVVVRYESRDYLIQAADLVLDSQALVPQRGDRVREVQGSTTFIYEVTAPGKEPAWRHSDPYRTALRIHTKQVDSEGN